MSLSTWFGFKVQSLPGSEELPDIFPLSITSDAFVKTDIVAMYSMILTDAFERCSGLSQDQKESLFDRYVKSENSEGLITMLSRAMADKTNLFLVWEPATKVLREATQDEQRQIESDYKKSAKSSVGIFLSFANYRRSDLVKLYSALEYCVIGALNKSLNLAKALQFKMSDMRSSTGTVDSAEVEAQAIKIAKALGQGKDVLLDAQDMLSLLKPDLDSVKESVEFLNQKRAFYLKMPKAYIAGEQTGGIGSTGEADQKAIERGLKNYFFSIIKPTIKDLWGVDLSYKTQDFRQIDNGLRALQTFNMVDDDLMSIENKKLIVSNLFDLEDQDGNQV